MRFLYTTHLQEVYKAQVAAGALFELMDMVSSIDPLDSLGDSPAALTGGVRLRNVHFSYPSRPSVRTLNNFFLSVK